MKPLLLSTHKYYFPKNSLHFKGNLYLCNLRRHKFFKLSEDATDMSKHIGVNII